VQCPVCDEKLTRVAYETHTVFQCPQCRGYLATKTRVSLIKSSRDLSTEALEEEAVRKEQADSATALRCPRCQGTMSKRKMPIQAAVGQSFLVDTCRRCNLVWFDGGELARLQLDHEQRPQGQEELAAQRREQTRTAAEREQFQQLLDALPRSESLPARLLGEIAPVPIALSIASLAAVLTCHLLYLFAGFPVWPTVAASLVFAAAIAWAILQVVPATGRNIGIVGVAVAVLTALWISFLLGAFSS
jgi:Zn-finger nucleic acid-binding protein